MKARIRKTGEIVDVICYGGNPNKRSTVLDYVNYIDSQGVEHTESNHLNYYWDFEPVETAIDIHWQDIKERAAIAAMQGLLCAPSYRADRSKLNMIAKDARNIADALIEELSIEQNTAWKPTGAQLASLEIACDRNDRIGFDLTQLLKDLKKL